MPINDKQKRHPRADNVGLVTTLIRKRCHLSENAPFHVPLGSIVQPDRANVLIGSSVLPLDERPSTFFMHRWNREASVERREGVGEGVRTLPVCCGTRAEEERTDRRRERVAWPAMEGSDSTA